MNSTRRQAVAAALLAPFAAMLGGPQGKAAISACPAGIMPDEIDSIEAADDETLVAWWHAMNSGKEGGHPFSDLDDRDYGGDRLWSLMRLIKRIVGEEWLRAATGMTDEDTEVLRQQDNKTLAKWHWDLGYWGPITTWPEGLAEEVRVPKRQGVPPRVKEIRAWIEMKVGRKECARQVVTGHCPGVDFEQWWQANEDTWR